MLEIIILTGNFRRNGIWNPARRICDSLDAIRKCSHSVHIKLLVSEAFLKKRSFNPTMLSHVETIANERWIDYAYSKTFVCMNTSHFLSSCRPQKVTCQAKFGLLALFDTSVVGVPCLCLHPSSMGGAKLRWSEMHHCPCLKQKGQRKYNFLFGTHTLRSVFSSKNLKNTNKRFTFL